MVVFLFFFFFLFRGRDVLRADSCDCKNYRVYSIAMTPWQCFFAVKNVCTNTVCSLSPPRQLNCSLFALCCFQTSSPCPRVPIFSLYRLKSYFLSSSESSNIWSSPFEILASMPFVLENTSPLVLLASAHTSLQFVDRSPSLSFDLE